METLSPLIEWSSQLCCVLLRSRLYELFSQIEKEFEALYVENMSLHTRVEALTDRLTEGGLPLEKAAEIFAITSEATSSKSTIGKKPSIQMGQKLKTAFKVPPGRNLVSSFKVGSDQNRVRFVRAFKGHRDGVWHVDAAATGVICSTSADQTARIWCAETGACFAQYLGHEGSVNCARFAPTTVGGGHEILVLSASGDQSAHVWKAPTAFVGSQTGSGHQSNFILPHSSEDEKFSDKEENVLDENDNYVIIRTPQLRLTGHTAPVVAADWLWTQNRIVTASWDRTAIVFDSERGEIVNILSGHDLELNHCCAHPSQNLIVTASKDTTFRLWDFRESIHSVAVFQGHIESVTSVVFTGGDKIVSGSDDRSVKVWDFRNMRTALSTVRLDSPVNRIAISRSNGLIAIPTDNRQVRLYDLAGTRITRLPSTSRRGHHRMVCCCAWADESSNCNLFTCGFDKLVLGWNLSMTKRCEKPDEDVQRYCMEKDLTIKGLLGTGAFSSVYLVQHNPSGCRFALKALIPFGDPAHAANEVRILSSIGGRNNVVDLLAFGRVDDRVLFLLDYVEFDEFSVVARTVLRHETKHYMYNLLSALKYIHGQGIIHRDIKPSNFLYSRKLKRYALIDFGLSLQYKSTSQQQILLQNDFEVATDDLQEKKRHCPLNSCYCSTGKGLLCDGCLKKPKPYVDVTGTIGYRAPETIVYAANSLAPAIDIWAAGVIFLCLLSRHYPFWTPEDDLASLRQMFAMLGTDTMSHAAERMRREVECSVYYPPLNMAKICTFLSSGATAKPIGGKEIQCNKCVPGASILKLPHSTCFCLNNSPGVHKRSNDYKIYSLLYEMLQPDPGNRVSAEEALNSRYFRSITCDNDRPLAQEKGKGTS
uniref:WD repeat-containing protein 37 n=1 Tax=Trichuris muris TaxID=70415 RepID=A0A5S6QK36_TRIMR